MHHYQNPNLVSKFDLRIVSAYPRIQSTDKVEIIIERNLSLFWKYFYLK